MELDKLIDIESIKDIQSIIESYNDKISPIVDSIISPYIKDLDNLLYECNSLIINNKDNVIDDMTLDKLIINLPRLMYFASEGQEIVAMKAALAKNLKKDAYLESLSSASGSATVKKLKAELDTIEDDVVFSIYEKCESRIKSKLLYAMELLQSAKKIASKRMTDNTWTPPYKSDDSESSTNKKRWF